MRERGIRHEVCIIIVSNKYFSTVLSVVLQLNGDDRLFMKSDSGAQLKGFRYMLAQIRPFYFVFLLGSDRNLSL